MCMALSVVTGKILMETHSIYLSLQSVLFPIVDSPAHQNGIGNGYQAPVEEQGSYGNVHIVDPKNVPDDFVLDDPEDGNDGISITETDNGAGVYLDGEQLTEEELLQVWEEISEGRISIQEAKDFINQLSDKEGHPVDFQKVSELAEAVRSRAGETQENQQVELPESPESEPVHNVYADNGNAENEVRAQHSKDSNLRLYFWSVIPTL
jgi:hypothetical protein